MRLTKLRIQNFRGIKDITIALDRGMTVLIGENNMGKTTILEALRLGLAQIKSSKTCNFSEYDFHRDKMKNHISRCEEIMLTYSWEESEKYPWVPEISQVLNEIIVGEEYAKISLRVTARYDEEDKELKQEWNFLDEQGNIFTSPMRQNLLRDLQKIRPLFFLSTLRNVKQEFHSKATFWSSFLQIKDIDKTTREKLEQELDKINRKIVDTQHSFKDVEKEIKRLSEIIAAGKTDPITVEPAAPDILSSLQHAQVNLLTENNVKIPLSYHGSGTQSLSVLLLFSAYLKTRLAKDIDPLAEPIIALEEPEAHLHPNAVRALWSLLQSLPGQKIIATHSGDILSEIPLHYLRRVKKEGDNTKIFDLPETLLEKEEIRKFTHHVRRNRGELLLARCWLLVEGETEVTVIDAAAEILDKNLSRCGIRLVEYSQAGGPGIFIKAADSLGIQWHTVTDTDGSGIKSAKIVEKLLQGKDKSECLTQLDSPNMDILLCQSGYGKPYLDGLPAGNQQSIMAPTGTIDFWKHVYKNLPNRFSKPAAAFEAISSMKEKGKNGIPPQIYDIINKAIRLAEV